MENLPGNDRVVEGSPRLFNNVDEVCLDLLRPQGEMVACQTKWAASRGGTGSGKTVGWCFWLIGRLEDYPLASHFVVGADYEQLRRGFFQSFVATLERCGYLEEVDYHYRESPSPMVTFLKTGARLRSLSSKLAERIRSVEFQTLLLEEPQTWVGGDKIFGILAGRLRHSQKSASLYGHTQLDDEGEEIPPLQTRGRMSFNPPARGSWLHTLIEKKWPAEGFPCWEMSVRNNHLMLDLADYVRGLELALDPSRWDSEIDGKWGTAGGNVYSVFDERANGRPAPGLDFRIDLTRPIKIGLDFNVRKMCMGILQIYEQPLRYGADGEPHLPIANWQPKIVRMLGEIVLPDAVANNPLLDIMKSPGAGSPDIIARFIRDWGDVARVCGVEVYGDASGGALTSTASSQSAIRSNWDAIEAGLTAAGIPYTMHVPDANPSVDDRVNAMNAQMKTGAGYGLMLDPEKNPDFVADLMQVERPENGVGINKKKDKARTHMSDAIGYVIYPIRNSHEAFAFYA